MRMLIALLTLALSACGSGIQNPMDDFPMPEINDSPGGLWLGTRSTGTEIIVLVSEDGEFRMLDIFGNVGFGRVVVSDTDQVSIAYDIAPPFRQSIFDGSNGAACSATGTVTERVLLDIETSCTSAMGQAFGNPLSLDFEDAYARTSSLAAIAGTYDDLGDVLTIDSTGALFEQSAGTGCVLNGQVSIIDPDWNLYRASFTTENCLDEFTPLNGKTWDGVVSLVDDAGVDIVLGGFSTQVDGANVGLLVTLTRI